MLIQRPLLSGSDVSLKLLQVFKRLVKRDADAEANPQLYIDSFVSAAKEHGWSGWSMDWEDPVMALLTPHSRKCNLLIRPKESPWTRRAAP